MATSSTWNTYQQDSDGAFQTDGELDALGFTDGEASFLADNEGWCAQDKASSVGLAPSPAVTAPSPSSPRTKQQQEADAKAPTAPSVIGGRSEERPKEWPMLRPAAPAAPGGKKSKTSGSTGTAGTSHKSAK